jgi:teichuronic acid biosynthesis glycosyltransferase TuaC
MAISSPAWATRGTGPTERAERPPLNLLIVSSRYPDEIRPGLGNFVERQMVELAARPGIALRIVAPLPAAPLPLAWLDGRSALRALPVRERKAGLDVHRPRCFAWPRRSIRPSSLVRTLLPLVRRLHAEAPIDLLCAEFFWPEGPAVAAVGRALGIPVSIKAQGIDFERPAAVPERRRLLLEAGRSAAGLLAVSEDVKAAMVAAGLPAGSIAIHRPAVDAARFDIADRSAAKAALRLSGPVLLTVGNLTPTKGQRLAVEALRHLPEATLVLVGTGPERKSLERLIRELGLVDRVRLTGSLPNPLLPAFYNAADVTIHCPSIEGFPVVRLESLACGTPLVTTAIGEARRSVSSAAAGRIVPPDPVTIAAAARELIEAPPDRSATRAASLGFGWAAATDQLEDYVRGLAAKA